MTDPARWLNEKLVGWKELANQEKKAIRDFPVLWSFFELRATGQNGNWPNATPERICKAIESLNANIEIEMLQQAKQYFSERYFQHGKPQHAYLKLGVKQGDKESVEVALLCKDVEAKPLLLGLLLIVNRLRNNFLHGEKAAYSFKNQQDNFRHASNVLMYAIALWDEPQERPCSDIARKHLRQIVRAAKGKDDVPIVDEINRLTT